MMGRTRQLVGAEPSKTLRVLPLVVLLVDVLMVAMVGAVAFVGRAQLSVFDPAVGIEEKLGVAGPLVVAGWVGVIALCGGYRGDLFGGGAEEYKRVLRATLLTAGLFGVGCYLAKFDFSRGFFLLAFLLGLPMLLLGRFLVRRALHSARRRGHLQVRVLVSGTPGHVDEVAKVLRRESWLGYSVVGAVTPTETLAEETASGVPVLGVADEVAKVAKSIRAEVIFFASGSMGSGQEMRERIWELEEEDIDVVIAPGVTDISSERIRVRPVGGLPLIHLDHPRWSDAGNLGKRAFDVVASGLLILVFSPVFVVAALRIWLFDRGPIIFRHNRIGRHGERFACFKFRTMVVGAENMVVDLQEESDQTPLLFKLKNDPRVTRPGRWLRRYSLDELPQLFNVLRGEMSLVGPRPQVQEEVDLYEGGMSRRLLVRPGMTGLWQVSGRNDLAQEEAMRLDLFYVDNWSMLQDLSILFRTFGAVISSRGAY